MSASPAADCISRRCAPSPQSTRMRSPPRRISVAEVMREAVGTEPAVPRKMTSRSKPG